MYALVALLSTLAVASASPVVTRAPNATSKIHAGVQPSLCVWIDTPGKTLAASDTNTPVQLVDCNSLPDQANWAFQRGSTLVKFENLNVCLDAGNAANGNQVVLNQCDGRATQQWYYTDDNRIALENQGFCLDITNGDAKIGTPLQVWQCGTGNNNQVFFSSL